MWKSSFAFWASNALLATAAVDATIANIQTKYSNLVNKKNETNLTNHELS